jgi:hypothetical protein
MVKKSELIFLLMLSFLSGCANQMAPGGGEVDKIPPTVIESFPKDGSTNFHENYLEIKFSEYVDRSSVQNAIFISPALQKGFEYSWTGKTLEIDIKDTLLSNTTYAVTIGTDVADLNNRNKMAESFSFVFSTGDRIDKGKITGMVRNEKISDVMVYAYQIEKDFDPAKIKPNYISQIGESGKFSLVGLRDGEYKILAMRDNLKDYLYQRNEDQFGVQSKKISLVTPQVMEVNNVDFFLTKEDTIAPKLSAAFMKDRNHLIVEFSEGIDSSKIDRNNFFIRDTVSNDKIIPSYFYKADLKPNQFYLGFKDTSSFKNYLLTANDFADIQGNLTRMDRLPFVYKADKDTFPNRIVKVFGDIFENKIDYEKPFVRIQFLDAIDSIEVASRVRIEEKKHNIPFELTKVDDALYCLHLLQKLKQGADYLLKFDVKNYSDISRKMVDTIYQHKFTSTSELDYSGVSGLITSNDSTQNYVIIESINPPKKTYQQKVDAKKKFDFKKVIPGKYLAWVYKDRNKNGKYDFGKIKPFSFSEEFKYFPDTLNLRARWPVGDVNIMLDK